MQAFHNDPAIKAHYLDRVRAHRAADEIIHGQYWEQGKGCAVGCTVHSGDHAAYETELGIPGILAILEDGIFEALAPPRDLEWPEAFLEAIPVGADLSMVWPQFALLLLSDAQYGVLRHVQAPQHAKQKEVIGHVITYYQEWVKTGRKSAAAAHAYAADAVAAAYAAYAATHAYAASAAADAAYAAAAAADAADVTAYAATAHATAHAAAHAAAAAEAANGAARQQARAWQVETLLALLREAPVPKEA